MTDWWWVFKLTCGGPGTFSAPGKGIFIGLRKTGFIGICWWELERSRGSLTPPCWWSPVGWSSSGRDLLLYSSRSVSICNQFKVFRTNKIQSSDDGSGLGTQIRLSGCLAVWCIEYLGLQWDKICHPLIPRLRRVWQWWWCCAGPGVSESNK